MKIPKRSADDRVDLRQVARTVFQGRVWIVATTIVAGAAALAFAAATPKSYQATALVAVLKPEMTLGGGELVQFALSDGALHAVLETGVAESVGMGSVSVEGLRDQLEAHISGTLLVLRATHAEPDVAAAVVNSWGDVLVELLMSNYRSEQASTVGMDALARGAEERWRAAEWSLRTAANSLEAERLQARKQGLLQLEGEYARVGETLNLILEQADAIHGALLVRNPSERAEADMEAAVLALESHILSDGVDESLVWGTGERNEGPPRSLEARPAGARTVGELIEALDAIVALAEQEKELIRHGETRLGDELRIVQQRLAIEETERARLQLERDIGEEFIRLIARVANEKEIAIFESLEVVKVISRATSPSEPIRPRPARDVPLASVAAFFLGLSWVLVRDWWKGING